MSALRSYRIASINCNEYLGNKVKEMPLVASLFTFTSLNRLSLNERIVHIRFEAFAVGIEHSNAVPFVSLHDEAHHIAFGI